MGVLATMIDALRDKALAFTDNGESITAASISIPRLSALYAEDLYDAFEYLSLRQIEFYPFNYYHPLYNTMPVLAGNDYGLCDDYKNVTQCKDQEEAMPGHYALAVHYTLTGVTTSLAYFRSAYRLVELYPYTNLLLGYNNHPDSLKEEFYWEMLKDALSFPIIDDPNRRITRVLVSGDAADVPKFRQVLGDVIKDKIAGHPMIIGEDDLVLSSSKGVANLALRALYRQRFGEDGGLSEL